MGAKLLPDRPVLMMVAEARPGLGRAAQAAVQGGVDTVLLRHKGASLEEIATAVMELRGAVGPEVPLLLNWGAVALPSIPGIDGLHLPEALLPAPAAIRWVQRSVPMESIARPDHLVGCSVHSLEAALTGQELNADYLLVGTVFPSSSHPGGECLGLSGLEEICRGVHVPVIAIGGVTPENAGACLDAGAWGVAALSPFAGEDARGAAEQLWRSLNP